MKITDVAFGVTNWSLITPTIHPGTTGHATWRTVERGNVRVRMVEYSANYLADHWCERGHVVLVLSGELISELKDGNSVTLASGMSYEVADGASSHRSRTENGATLFIVD